MATHSKDNLGGPSGLSSQRCPFREPLIFPASNTAEPERGLEGRVAEPSSGERL